MPNLNFAEALSLMVVEIKLSTTVIQAVLFLGYTFYSTLWGPNI